LENGGKIKPKLKKFLVIQREKEELPLFQKKILLQNILEMKKPFFSTFLLSDWTILTAL